jgi:hypothetical protein
MGYDGKQFEGSESCRLRSGFGSLSCRFCAGFGSVGLVPLVLRGGIFWTLEWSGKKTANGADFADSKISKSKRQEYRASLSLDVCCGEADREFLRGLLAHSRA